MWIPATVEELEHAVREGAVPETAVVDFKEALPIAKKNHDLAVDIGAMTTDGGVLIYGVGEDEHRRPTVLAPIELAGARERIAQVAQTSILPPPQLDVRELRCDDGSGHGYLVVAAPRSAVAPHQVISGKDYRYYGRGATGNRILTESEVALLYQRRDQWELDRDAHLAELVKNSMFQPDEALVYLHAFARPVAPDGELVERAAPDRDVPTLLHELLRRAAEVGPQDSYSPDIRHANSVQHRGAEGWRFHDGLQGREKPDPRAVIYIEFDRDGAMRFFCGRVGDTRDDDRLIFETSIAGNATVAYALAGLIYERAGFVGEVDVGVAVTNLLGAVSIRIGRSGVWGGTGFGNDDYRRTARIPASRLADDPRQVVRDLCGQMFEITLPRGADPFEGQRR
jgi:hypothetical protein